MCLAGIGMWLAGMTAVMISSTVTRIPERPEPQFIARCLDRVVHCCVKLPCMYTHRLDTPQQVIIRETKHCEGTWKQLAAAGAPVSVSGYEDADAAANVFSAIAPQCLAKFELHQLELPMAQQQQQQ